MRDFNVVYQMIDRKLGGYQEQFQLEWIAEVDGKDVFEIDGEKDKIVLRGNNNISLAKAFHEYIKYEVKGHFSWCGNQLNLPKEFPIPSKKVRQVIKQKYRAYFNYCTFNYTASWWNWERWEQEIDFMALNGINMPLAIVGVEGVWYEALLKIGLSDEEIREFLVGPAYLAWQWMTNIQSHGGPLPKNWIDKHVELGRRILKRQVEWGMKPIQQGFSGYVPKIFQSKFPEAKINIEESWCGFEGTAQLDPLDPLFKEFGQIFLETQKELFGVHHYYAADPFHEGKPPIETEEYLTKVGEAISSLFFEFDDEATWVMQAWSIRKEIVTAVPKEKLLILDLGGYKAKQKEYFWGYPFITGNLHNFGGRTNLHGDLGLIGNNQFMQIKKEAENVCGTGLFMESIMQNPVYYDLAFELLTSSNEVEVENWLDAYSERRYGKSTKQANKAWGILLDTVYQEGTNGVENSSIICARPAIEVKKSGPNAGFDIPYETKKVWEAFELLLEIKEKCSGSEGYRYDLVDILRQILSNYGQELHNEMKKSFYKKDLKALKEVKKLFLTLLTDIDKLVGTRAEFSLEKWVKEARAWGEDEQEQNLYELNAKMLVTMWGPQEEKAESIIFDYAWKEWSGLIQSYYRMRWEKFYNMIENCLVEKKDYSEKELALVHGRERLCANQFYEELAKSEWDWVKNSVKLKEYSKQSDIECVMILVEKYRQNILNLKAEEIDKNV